MESKIKVALIQQSYKGSKSSTQQISAQMIKEAAQNGAQLVLLQELHTQEYFCQSENVDFFDYALSFEADCEYFSQIAKNNKLHFLNEEVRGFITTQQLCLSAMEALRENIAKCTFQMTRDSMRNFILRPEI